MAAIHQDHKYDIITNQERPPPPRDFRVGAAVKAMQAPGDPNVDIITGSAKPVPTSPRANYHRTHPPLAQGSADLQAFNIISALPVDQHQTQQFPKKMASPPVSPAAASALPIAGRSLPKSPSVQRQGSSNGALQRELQANQGIDPVTGAELPEARRAQRRTSSGYITKEFRDNGSSVNPITGQKLPLSPRSTRSMGQFQKELRENGSGVNPITGERVLASPRRVPTSPRQQ